MTRWSEVACLLALGVVKKSKFWNQVLYSSLRTSCGVILSPSFRFHPFLRSSRGEQTGSKAPRFLWSWWRWLTTTRKTCGRGSRITTPRSLCQAISSRCAEQAPQLPLLPPQCLAGSYHLMAADNGCSQLARPLTAPWPAKGGGSRSQGWRRRGACDVGAAYIRWPVQLDGRHMQDTALE